LSNTLKIQNAKYCLKIVFEIPNTLVIGFIENRDYVGGLFPIMFISTLARLFIRCQCTYRPIIIIINNNNNNNTKASS